MGNYITIYLSGTATGAHLLRKILQIRKDVGRMFVNHYLNITVEYDVALDSDQKSGEVTVFPNIVIDDVHSSDKIQCPIHINTSNIPQNFYFNLRSKDGMEYRFYKVNFITDAFTIYMSSRGKDYNESKLKFSM